MKKHIPLLGLIVLTACSASPLLDAQAKDYNTALRHDVSFTQYAVTTHLILRNDGGCEELSGGWVDSANINNLLFLGQPQYQKWVKPGRFVMDGVGMALFWDRSVRFVYACKNDGLVTYHHTEYHKLNESHIRQGRVNLVISCREVDGQVIFNSNYPHL